MNLNFDETLNVTIVELAENDICYDCLIADKCPLIGAFQQNVIYPATNEFGVYECELKV